MATGKDDSSSSLMKMVEAPSARKMLVNWLTNTKAGAELGPIGNTT
ncbi:MULTISPECIES: hypothetical protein [Gammaproteobacteria]|nr:MULTISPECIES: hypothetical protein [Gammaproteobacteria]